MRPYAQALFKKECPLLINVSFLPFFQNDSKKETVLFRSFVLLFSDGCKNRVCIHIIKVESTIQLKVKYFFADKMKLIKKK